jgi:hypothetical protein
MNSDYFFLYDGKWSVLLCCLPVPIFFGVYADSDT